MSTQKCRERKVNVAISDSDGTSIDQSVEQIGMGLTISNPGISNTINRYISLACLIMNTALLAAGNPINTNVILESCHSATTVNSSVILSTNTAGISNACIPNTSNGSFFNNIHMATLHKLSDKFLTFEQQKEKRDLANVKRRQAYTNKQCVKVDVAISDFGGTSIDQFVEQNGMGLTISNPGISNTINKDISQACLIMNAALLATGNPIDTNAILESDQSATTVNPSAIVFANTTSMSNACIPNTSNGSFFNKIHTSIGMVTDDCNG
ncbi:hypothetical protein GIB67_028533 [Kingdonia uniflora]|uniref:Uncharacterized protein n=1 Tax=Kingdonia uniflora TaxID=39325 RepID=A0A7J7KW18_9MAGN|nr:hypothetical protein GIB67_028533 [Kingdonia uniflora]